MGTVIKMTVKIKKYTENCCEHPSRSLIGGIDKPLLRRRCAPFRLWARKCTLSAAWGAGPAYSIFKVQKKSLYFVIDTVIP